MKIALVCYLTEKIGPKKQGYYYRLYHLGEELIRRGHKVTFFAAHGSKTSAKLITPGKFIGRGDFELYNIENAILKSKEFDIINIQMDHRGIFFNKLCKTPILNTIIYGDLWPDIKNLLEEHKNLNYSTISHNLKKIYPKLNWQGVVHNGVALKNFPYNEKPADYLLSIGGAIHPKKGTDIAVRIAKKTKQKLIIAGPIKDEEYFKTKIKPHLSQKIKYVGNADFKTKIKLYQNALAFLFPVSYEEGFGNTLIESLACGTPVIAYKRGSIPEIIKNKKTGFVCTNEKQLVEAVKNINKIKRKNCRADCEKRFSIEKMTDNYEKLYQKIINKNKR